VHFELKAAFLVIANLKSIFMKQNANYGRPLSVSGRPCYILPMFIYLFIFYGALFSGPG